MRASVAFLLVAATACAAEMKVHRDLAYAGTENERQTLDVYAPGEGAGHPVLFWIHGGGWEKGDKAQVHAKPRAFVDRGFVFVSTNYRLLGEVTIKQMTGDVAKAFCWVHEHAGEYGGDPGAMFIMGHSAGAQLAALVSTDGGYLKSQGLSLAAVKGCMPVDGGTYDVPLQVASVEKRIADIFRRKFGDEKSQKELSAVTHVARGKHIPPFLMLYVAGRERTTGQSKRFAKSLREAGVPARAYAAEGKTHRTLNSELGLRGDKATAEVFEFLRGRLKASK